MNRKYGAVAFIGMIYIVIIFNIISAEYINNQLQSTFEIKYIYMEYIRLGSFYLIIGILICGLYTCGKRHLLLEILILDIPILIIVFEGYLFLLFPSNAAVRVIEKTGELIPQGALLCGVEFMRFYRLVTSYITRRRESANK